MKGGDSPPLTGRELEVKKGEWGSVSRNQRERKEVWTLSETTRKQPKRRNKTGKGDCLIPGFRLSLLTSQRTQQSAVRTDLSIIFVLHLVSNKRKQQTHFRHFPVVRRQKKQKLK